MVSVVPPPPFVLLDVRTPEEFAEHALPRSLNVPYDSLDFRQAELPPPSTPIVVYCRSGRRSEIAAQWLRSHGYTHVVDVSSVDQAAQYLKEHLS